MGFWNLHCISPLLSLPRTYQLIKAIPIRSCLYYWWFHHLGIFSFWGLWSQKCLSLASSIIVELWASKIWRFYLFCSPSCHYYYCYYYCLVFLLVICWTTWSSWKFIIWKKLFRCGTWIERVKLRFDWLVRWQCWVVFISWKNGRPCGDPRPCRRMHMLMWDLLVAMPCLVILILA